MKRKIMASLASALLVLTGLLAFSASPAQAATNYYFVQAKQVAHTDGYGATITIGNPYIDTTNDFHSLAQVAVYNTAITNTIEIGWQKDLALFGNNRPHLYVFNRRGGAAGCYNGCGWVDNPSNPVDVGADLVGSTGTAKNFLWTHDTSSHNWNGWYDGSIVGQYPDSYWTSIGESADLADEGRVLGEVATARTNPCTDMGTGPLGSGTGPLHVTNFQKYDDSTATLSAGNFGTSFKAIDGALNPLPAGTYDYANTTATSFDLGGPGWSSIGEVTDNAVGSCAPSTAGTPNNTLVLWGQECPDANGATGCTNKYNTAASCSPAPCLISGALAGTTYTTWQNTSTSGKSFTVGRTAACTGTQLTLAPNGSGTAKGVLPAGWDGQNIKCIRRIA